MDHQHLTVGRTAADTDHGNAQLLTDALRQSGRNLLQHDAEATGLFQSVSVGNQLLGLSFLASPHGIGAELVDALRREPEMTHHGNAGIENLADGVDDLHPTLQLESVAVGLLHDADGVGDTFRGIHLIRTERHITNDQRTLGAAHNGFGVINHLIERHGQSGERTGHHIGG